MALAVLSVAAFAQDPAAKVWQMPGPEGGEPRIQIIQNMERMDPPKFSPKQKWIFEWVTSGMGRENVQENQLALRIRVFAQQQKEKDDPSPKVARMAMRLWDYNNRVLGIPHSPMFDDGRVHFYLCFGGEAGGEQLFDEDEEGDRRKKVNTIYIYQIQNLRQPLEMAREVAHEYGHATLPAVGGFKTPEDWANGYLGEKLFLRYLRNELAAKRLGYDDSCGATVDQLDAFVKGEVDPLCAAIALKGPPEFDKLGGSGPVAMDAYMGLTLYIAEILPPRMFSRTLKLTGSTSARDVPAAISLAIEEPPTYVVAIPDYLKGKDVWVPVGKGKVSGAGVLKKQGDWALIRPLEGAVRVTNRPSS